MIKLFSFSLFLMFLSCSLRPVAESDQSYATVDVLDQAYDQKLEVDPNSSITSNEYGPQPNSILKESLKMAPSSKVLGLTFLPAGYLSIGYIGVLKKLVENELKPNMLVCPEMAALVCLLYAKYNDLNRVEWEIYDFYSKLKRENFYSTPWREMFLELVEKEFGDQRLETLSILVGIPIKISSSKVKVFSKGKILDLMKSNIRVSGNYPMSVITETYIDYKKYFKNRGADKILEVAIVPLKNILEVQNGYLLGTYSKLFYSVKKRFEDKDSLIEIDKTIDSSDDIMSVANIAYDKSDLLTQEIKTSLKIER